MRLRNIPGSKEAVANSRCVIGEPQEYRGKWSALFGNAHPLQIEVGMGKGRFIMELARLHPEINYIGIERYDSVLLRAVQKREQSGLDLANLYFIRMDAKNLEEVFGPGEVDRIYLNFSDPWPKDRHVKRRLTSRQFLERYEKILTEGGRIDFKTDNRDLFDFSLEEVQAAGWELLQCTYDLHNDPALSAGNVMTEYEERFSLRGNPIHKLSAVYRKKTPPQPANDPS